jgi:hypothetical protein
MRNHSDEIEIDVFFNSIAMRDSTLRALEREMSNEIEGCGG